MMSPPNSSKRYWLSRHAMSLLTFACLAIYGAFIQWQWGWGQLLSQWSKVGAGTTIAALVLLTATYLVRAQRIYDYFPAETSRRFLKLFRLTQVHNLLNIMLPFRAGETSFPLLMRSQFAVPLPRATAALLVMRLLDLHALCAAAGVGLVLGAENRGIAWFVWIAFLVSPLAFFAAKALIFRHLNSALPQRLEKFLEEIEAGIPADTAGFVRAWAFTILNWGVKVIVLAWVLGLLGVTPLTATFGGALGGELSSVLPLHAPGGVGTYPAGIAAGAVAFGAAADKVSLAAMAEAAINAHLLIVASACVGTALSIVLSWLPSKAR
ncbi:flippase-like domain-containing protein [Rhizobium sp. ARZ01]|uniref:lysylphosphatidylglycerol synthase transmembrane domain-containing protein n=1 Tax=Rhizobium sp. ARZ01 TaxID=2769313 RepID=UPI00177ECC87|nr:lysylphosphatidylglycerol synthase transmembrane domain-containing protein [Rhizobium sp. ARZ01]MBD9371591.1 flippase-like domain-containing protein [Rhizobium sp. ARZ01]